MIGARIGSYEITKTLASGGMGDVYRGRHVELPREVVVKTIQLANYPEKMHGHLKKRFRREAYIQSQLDHPNIVRVYEFIPAQENSYLVMEYVDGMSLADLLKKRGRLPPLQAIALIKQALEALDYAHRFTYVDEAGVERCGIIHRDIKPANMLLDGKSDRLKLTDFGIVKMVGEHSLTQFGLNPGTIEYMSPEQLLGVGEIDGRSDLYSIGISLYELIAGRPPFVREKASDETIVRKGHLQLSPQPLTDLCPQLDPRLNAVTVRALSKDATERFQTARSFINALVDCQQTAQGALAETDRFEIRTLLEDDLYATVVSPKLLSRTLLDKEDPDATVVSPKSLPPTLLLDKEDPYETVVSPNSLPPTLLNEDHPNKTIIVSPDSLPPNLLDKESYGFSTRLKSRITAVIHPLANFSLWVLLALCTMLLIGGALWWKWKTETTPLQATVAPLHTTMPELPVEALRYFVTLGKKQLSGLEALPEKQTFRLSFKPRVDGYLYVIAPPDQQNNQLMTLVTPSPMKRLGVKTNQVSAAAGLSLKLQIDRGPNTLIVIFSPQPMKSPGFLAARSEHTLTEAERGELTELRKQYSNGVKAKVRAQETVVIVPASRDGTRPLIFEMTLTGQ